MNQRDCELNALGRIIIQIKTYRQMRADMSIHTVEQKLDEYLREHLLDADWQLWFRLHVTPASSHCSE